MFLARIEANSDAMRCWIIKWEGNINELKDRVKGDIEDLAAGWSQEEKDECVAATAATFRFAGAINKYLSGGKSSH